MALLKPRTSQLIVWPSRFHIDNSLAHLQTAQRSQVFQKDHQLFSSHGRLLAKPAAQHGQYPSPMGPRVEDAEDGAHCGTVKRAESPPRGR